VSKLWTHFQNAHGSIIRFDNTIEIWSFMIMLTRKALIVHCLTSPPSAPDCDLVFRSCRVAQRKKIGGENCWMARMTLNLHLAKRQKYSSGSLKSSRDRKDENVSLLWHFVCGVSVDNLAPKNAVRQVGWKSLIILIVSEALVRIGQPGLDID